MDFAALSKNIAGKFPRLSPQLQRAARHILGRPDDLRAFAADDGIFAVSLEPYADETVRAVDSPGTTGGRRWW